MARTAVLLRHWDETSRVFSSAAALQPLSQLGLHIIACAAKNAFRLGHQEADQTIGECTVMLQLA